MRKQFAVIIMVLLVLCLAACGSGHNYEKISWDDIVLGDIIPKTKSNKGKILLNQKENLSVYIYDISEKEYFEYIEKCRKEGFVVDEEAYGASFTAYNEKGYCLSLYYNGSDEEMHIGLDAPLQMGEYKLPEYAIKAGLPTPKSQEGSYNWKYDDNFLLVVNNTSIEEYESYKQECIDFGFVVDSQDGNDFYNASNSDGYRLNLHYKGNNLMSIKFECPENMETTDSEDAVAEETILTEQNSDEMYFYDAESFENALNQGIGVDGAIVTFLVNDYKPESILGYNAWAGDHLNFIFDNDVKLNSNDVVTVMILHCDKDMWGSWVIECELVSVEQSEIEEIVTENTTEELPEDTTEYIILSEYEKAFVRDLSSYELYIMFDEDTNTVVCFGTADTYIMEGSYTGVFSSGIDINWVDDGYHEKFTYSGNDVAVLTDGNGYEWEYEKCDIEVAQSVLDKLR